MVYGVCTMTVEELHDLLEYLPQDMEVVYNDGEIYQGYKKIIKVEVVERGMEGQKVLIS